MKLNYSYSYLLNEFKDGMTENNLKTDDYIWIIRNEISLKGNYRPIIDWYYLDEFQTEAPSYHKINAMKMQLTHVVEEMLAHSDFM